MKIGNQKELNVHRQGIYIRATAETVRQYKYRIKSMNAKHVVAYIDKHPWTITGRRHII